MNRDYLKNLGLEQEVIDGIMAEHGKAIQSAKPSDYDELKTKSETLAKQVASLNTITEEKEALAKQVTALEKKELKTRIALEHKLPLELADRLTGETEEELKADAQSLSGFMSQKTVLPLASTEPNLEKDSKEEAYKSVVKNLNIKGE